MLQGVFEKSFAKIPNEPATPGLAQEADGGKSDVTGTTRLAALQEQVGAQQVRFCTDGCSFLVWGTSILTSVGC